MKAVDGVMILLKIHRQKAGIAEAAGVRRPQALRKRQKMKEVVGDI